MRILVLTDEIFPDAVGGVGRAVMNTVSAWVKDGHLVTVLVRRIDPSLPLHGRVGEVDVVRFAGPSRHQWFYYLYPLSIMFRPVRWLRSYANQYDIIVVHNPLYLVPLKTAGVSVTTPLVLNIHSPLLREVQISAAGGRYGAFRMAALFVAWCLDHLEAWAIRKADHIVVHSPYMLSEIQRVHGSLQFHSKTTIIPIGLDLDQYVPRDKQAVRQQLQLAYDRPILLTIRRLVERMGLPELVEAMQLVHQEHPDALLLIGGQGRIMPILKNQILALGLESMVHLLGFVREQELPLYMAAADLFLMPTSQLEGFGLATAEALACGTPVIGTPVGATPSLLEPIDSHLITEELSISALARTICFWLDRPEELSRLSHRCRAIAEKQYSASEVGKHLIVLFEILIQNKCTKSVA